MGEVFQMRAIVSMIAIIFGVVSFSGCCAIFPQTWKAYNNQVTCKSLGFCGWEGGTYCSVYDPVFKNYQPIDPDNGVVNTCSKETHSCKVFWFEKAQCYTCQDTFTDAAGNSWTTKPYDERVLPQGVKHGSHIRHNSN